MMNQEQMTEMVEAMLDMGWDASLSNFGGFYWDDVVDVETPNARYLVEYEPNHTGKVRVTVSELKPSYGGGYEWQEQQERLYKNAKTALQFIRRQEKWYESY